MCLPFLGRVCTSSAKYQDNLFDDNAIPPTVVSVLGDENKRTHGAVEAYIYGCFTKRYYQLKRALDYCQNARPDDFDVRTFINSFWLEAGKKRSLDKVYEIVVYSLFSTLVEALDLKVEISVDKNAFPLLEEFEDFSKKVMCLDTLSTKQVHSAKVYRVGVTNAADRGLDMYSNWGPAIQVKHLSLDVDLAKDIVSEISSDKVIIVCKDAEKDVIVSLLTQIGWKKNIQSVVTENDLVSWYDKALRGIYSYKLANKLLATLAEEISLEFPSVHALPDILLDRHYEQMRDDYWKM